MMTHEESPYSMKFMDDGYNSNKSSKGSKSSIDERYEVSFPVVVPYDMLMVVFGSLIAFGSMSAFLAFFSLGTAMVPLLVYGCAISYFIWKKKQISGVSRNLPHEVIDNFMLWEKGDKIIIGQGSTIKNLKYLGVTEGGLIRCKEASMGATHIVSTRLFEMMEYKNQSLRNRKARKSRTNKVGGNYKEFVEAAQKEFNALMNKKIKGEKEWNHMHSKTSQSRKSTRVSETK